MTWLTNIILINFINCLTLHEKMHKSKIENSKKRIARQLHMRYIIYNINLTRDYARL